MAKVTDTVEALARPIVEEQGCTLWDVEYVKEAGCLLYTSDAADD